MILVVNVPVVTTMVTNHVDTDLEDFFVRNHNVNNNRHDVDNNRHSSFSGDRLHPGLGRGDGWQPGRAEDQDAEYGRGEDGDHLEGGDHLGLILVSLVILNVLIIVTFCDIVAVAHAFGAFHV